MIKGKASTQRGNSLWQGDPVYARATAARPAAAANSSEPPMVAAPAVTTGGLPVEVGLVAFLEAVKPVEGLAAPVDDGQGTETVS